MRNQTLVMALLASVAAAACSATDSASDPAPSKTPPAVPNGDAKLSDPKPGGYPSPSTTPSEPSAVDAAKASFWKAFYAGRYEDLEAARQQAFAAYKADPKNPDAARIAYYTQFWRVGDGPNFGMTEEQIGQERGLAMKLLQEARALNPKDLVFDAWLGGNLIAAGYGRDDAQMRTMGKQLLDAVATRGDEGGILAAGILNEVAYGEQPPGSPEYEGAVEAMYKVIDWCVGTPIDRNNPDMKPHMDKATDAIPKKICWSNPHTPHYQEGFFMVFADMLVKQGNLGAARVAYENIKLAPGFQTWKRKAMVDERLSSDLAARSALYRDTDEHNDPPLGVGSCTGCHSN